MRHQIHGRWFEIRVDPIWDENGALVGAVHTMSDVTDRTRLDERFRQARKMESIAQLAAGVAHEFNNLLTAILGYADLMRIELPETHPMQENVGRIRGAGHRAADATRRLLAFSRKQVMRPVVLDLTALVTSMETVLRRAINDRVVLQTVPASKPWPVEVDPTRMGQVIMNLALNASDAMPDGGRLVIETANVAPDEPFLAQHPEIQRSDHVKLAISDSGAGMSEEVQSRLFEPFFTTKEVGKGDGMGLPVVYGIIHQSGGHIYCESAEDSGTTFTIYLPRAAKDLGID